MDQVGPATRQHPEAQIQLELGHGGVGAQTFEGQEAALGPAETNARGSAASASPGASVSVLIGCLLQLSGFTVQPREQQPGRLSDIIAVHQQAAAMFCVHHGHPDPLHEGGAGQEPPTGSNGVFMLWSAAHLSLNTHLIL